MMLYIIGFFLLILSVFEGARGTVYLFTGKHKPSLSTLCFLFMANYGFVFNMLWNHSCGVVLIHTDFGLAEAYAYPDVDLMLSLLSVFVFGFSLLGLLSIWVRDELYHALLGG